MKKNFNKLVNILNNGGIAVMPTDTIHGIVCRAQNKETVEQIYKLKKRNPTKATIILIDSIDRLRLFDVIPTDEIKKILSDYWPGPVSIILDCHDEKYSYLHRGTNSLAFRLPDNETLQELIKATGPLVAPSANIEDMPPATNNEEAYKYFGDNVDIYVDGPSAEKASKIIKISTSGVEVIRP
jgi:L-threonylcarbamoyladenylate synthase